MHCSEKRVASRWTRLTRGAGRVDDLQVLLLSGRDDRRGYAMRAENKSGPDGHFIKAFHKGDATRLKVIDNRVVVHDLMINIKRGAVGE